MEATKIILSQKALDEDLQNKIELALNSGSIQIKLYENIWLNPHYYEISQDLYSSQNTLANKK
uniref:Transposase n=1 Tax=Meloidogyne hapla TaxID=6305 RepID=A0A1I8BBA4_MELHA